MNSVMVWTGGTQASVYLTVSLEAIHIEAAEDLMGKFGLCYQAGERIQKSLNLIWRRERAFRRFASARTLLLTILHDDPYEVEEAFRTVFSSHQTYWIKAFAKMLKERLRIEVEFEV